MADPTGGIMEGPPKDDQEREARKAGWKSFLMGLNQAMQDPVRGPMIFRLGTELMKDTGVGQSGADKLGRAMQSSMQAGQDIEAQQREQAAQERKFGLEERGLDLTARGQDLQREGQRERIGADVAMNRENNQLRKAMWEGDLDFNRYALDVREGGADRRLGLELQDRAAGRAFESRERTRQREFDLNVLDERLRSAREIAELGEAGATQRSSISGLLQLIEMEDVNRYRQQQMEQAQEQFDATDKRQWAVLTEQINNNRDQLMMQRLDARDRRRVEDETINLEKRRLEMLEGSAGAKLDEKLFDAAVELVTQQMALDPESFRPENVTLIYTALKAGLEGRSATAGLADRAIESLRPKAEGGLGLPPERARLILESQGASAEDLAKFDGAVKEASKPEAEAEPEPEAQAEAKSPEQRAMDLLRGSYTVTGKGLGDVFAWTGQGIKGHMNIARQLKADEVEEAQAQLPEARALLRELGRDSPERKLVADYIRKLEELLKKFGPEEEPAGGGVSVDELLKRAGNL